MVAQHSDASDSWRSTRPGKAFSGEAPTAPGGEGRRRERRGKAPTLALAQPGADVGAIAALTDGAVAAALQEITTVPAATLHHGAALAWATRAVACYRVCLGKRDVPEGLSYLYLGEHYREAALGEAALGEAWRPMYLEVAAVMARDREDASVAMQRRRSRTATT